MKKSDLLKVREMLRESNAIEGVYDKDSFKQAELAWYYLMEQKTITPGVILKTHKILMLHSNLLPIHKGYFRDCEVTVGGRYGLRYEKVPEAIETWCDDVAVKAQPKAMHVDFEKIHPFVDGNGRVGRMLYNWMRLDQELPIDVIKESERQAYYSWFRD